MNIAERFSAVCGHPPEGVWQSPGRVNLIGEHTDYCEGLAITFAIDRRTAVAAARRSDQVLRCWSSAEPEAPPASVDLTRIGPRLRGGWERYPAGVLWAMRQAGIDAPALDLVVDSTVPIGSGLSSSAALEAAVAVAAADLVGEPSGVVGRRDLVQICHRAEAEFVGVPTGLLDQLSVLEAVAGHGLLIDFRSLAVELLPLDLAPLVVVDTGVRHQNDDGAYAARRQACEEAAAALGVAQLRDATPAMLAGGIGGVLARRARHVVTEDERVLEAAWRLRHGGDVGSLLDASHRSLRDDFEVSCPELDTVVSVARRLGAAGARMTGAGFGGSCIVIGVDADRLAPAVAEAFASAGYRSPPVTFAVTPVSGAGRLA